MDPCWPTAKLLKGLRGATRIHNFLYTVQRGNWHLKERKQSTTEFELHKITSKTPTLMSGFNNNLSGTIIICVYNRESEGVYTTLLDLYVQIETLTIISGSSQRFSKKTRGLNRTYYLLVNQRLYRVIKLKDGRVSINFPTYFKYECHTQQVLRH